MEAFNKYDFLWKADLQQAYEKFMRTNPPLEAFEAELKKYMAIETDVNAIPGVHNIGALSLETLPLKTSLKNEAGSWKAQFAQNLHKQCSENLKAFDTYIRDTTVKLNRKIEDLEVSSRSCHIDPITLPPGRSLAFLSPCLRAAPSLRSAL